MDFEEILTRVADEGVRAELKKSFTEVNKAKGEFGLNLINKDKEIKDLKGQQLSYTNAFAAMKKKGIELDQIPDLLEQFGYQKTINDEYALTKGALELTTKELKDKEKKIVRLEAEKAVRVIFEKARADLKDENGVSVKLSENFIDYNSLFDIKDLSNETVLKEKVSQVLNKGLETQVATLREIGHVPVKLHQTPAGGQQVHTEILDYAKITSEHGAASAIAAMRAYNEKQKK